MHGNDGDDSELRIVVNQGSVNVTDGRDHTAIQPRAVQ